jgi:hypothetical protein
MFRVCLAVLSLIPTVILSACAPNTRLVVEPSAAALAQSKRAVALMKFGMPQEACIEHYLWLGVRDGNGHRRVARLQAPGSPRIGSANATEVELDPGEYHVLGYACQRARSTIAFGSHGGPVTHSLASFTLAAGEVVNVGYITAKRRAQHPGAPVDVAVADWPLDDFTRFKAERPTLFAAMQTRLAAVKIGQPLTADEKAERCQQLKVLASTGKLQNVPTTCPSDPARRTFERPRGRQ